MYSNLDLKTDICEAPRKMHTSPIICTIWLSHQPDHGYLLGRISSLFTITFTSTTCWVLRQTSQPHHCIHTTTPAFLRHQITMHTLLPLISGDILTLTLVSCITVLSCCRTSSISTNVLHNIVARK